MRIELSREGVFTPSFHNNKALPEADQVRVHFRWPTYADEPRFSYGRIDFKDESGKSDRRLVRRMSAYMVHLVHRIDNLLVNGEPVSTGEALVNSPVDMSDLIAEIYLHICMGQGLSASRAEKKSPLSSSASSSSKVSPERKRARKTTSL